MRRQKGREGISSVVTVMNWQKPLEPPDHREERPLSAWHLVSRQDAKMEAQRNNARAWNQHQHISNAIHQEEGEAHNGKNWDVIRWKWGGSERASKGGLYLTESCTLTVLPEFPDKTAVLYFWPGRMCGRQQSVNPRCSPLGWAAGGRANVTIARC